MATQVHMDTNKRLAIENGLNNKMSFKAIAKMIHMDCTTVSKEIKKHSVERNISAPGRVFNNCINRHDCQLYNVCTKCNFPTSKLCRSCNLCRTECDQFVEEVCEKLKKPPYVCNGCEARGKCTLTKNLYFPLVAQKQYEQTLTDSRSGICITEEDIDRLNTLLVPLMKEKKQSIHHIYIHHADEIMMSEKTLYKIIDCGLLKVRNIDMPRKVRRRIRRKKNTTYKVDKQCLEGRRYEDFLRFLENKPDSAVVEMDTVEGKKGQSCILTIHFRSCSFMIAVKRECNDSKSVTDYFHYIYEVLGRKLFIKLFPVILADKGPEFSNPSAIEFDEDGKRRTYVFYCHPGSPQEKGSCEVNHQFIRRIIPKGESMDCYTQKDINLMMSHIDSYAREKLNDKSPFLLFKILYGEVAVKAFSITCIDSDDINLSPSLLPK